MCCVRVSAAEKARARVQITTERVEQAKGDVIIMHPGPVNYVEISENAYQSDSSVIRHQVSNSVAIRMAVLSRFLSS